MIVRSFSNNVRRRHPIVSANLRRKMPLIARQTVYDCAPLHISPALSINSGPPGMWWTTRTWRVSRRWSMPMSSPTAATSSLPAGATMPLPNPSRPDREDSPNGKSRTGELAANQPNALDRIHDRGSTLKPSKILMASFWTKGDGLPIQHSPKGLGMVG